MTTTTTAVLVLLLASCSSSSSKSVDASPTSDAHHTDGPRLSDGGDHLDARPIDAAQASSVTVVANCTGVTNAEIAATITTSGTTFTPSTATIAHGKYLKFTTTGFHNFQNIPSAPANATFSSGSPGAQTACLLFTVAGSYPFECVVHAGMGMTGTLTVN
jgi:plastocyanin